MGILPRNGIGAGVRIHAVADGVGGILAAGERRTRLPRGQPGFYVRCARRPPFVPAEQRKHDDQREARKGGHDQAAIGDHGIVPLRGVRVSLR
jgi:hypothetical protein